MLQRPDHSPGPTVCPLLSPRPSCLTRKRTCNGSGFMSPPTFPPTHTGTAFNSGENRADREAFEAGLLALSNKRSLLSL